MSDRPGIGHVIVQGVAAAGFDLAPAVQEAIVGVVEATITTYLKKMVDEAVSDRVRDGSSSRASSVTASSVTATTASTASTESAASDSEAASPPASPASTASSASAIPADESPMDTSAPPQPLPSSAAAKRPLSDNSSPSGDETAVPTPPSDSEGGFLEVASRKKKNRKKRRNATVVVSSAPSVPTSQPPTTTATIPSLMDVVVPPSTITQAPQASVPAPKAKKYNTCSAQPVPRQAVPPVILRDSDQWSRTSDLCQEHRIFYTKARPCQHGVSIEDDIRYVTDLLEQVNLDEICRVSRMLQRAASPAERLNIFAKYEHVLNKLI
ncbi:hypothetical protein ACJJTC_011492 [Scirpophaga incertulas]